MKYDLKNMDDKMNLSIKLLPIFFSLYCLLICGCAASRHSCFYDATHMNIKDVFSFTYSPGSANEFTSLYIIENEYILAENFTGKIPVADSRTAILFLSESLGLDYEIFHNHLMVHDLKDMDFSGQIFGNDKPLPLSFKETIFPVDLKRVSLNDIAALINDVHLDGLMIDIDFKGGAADKIVDIFSMEVSLYNFVMSVRYYYGASVVLSEL